MKINESPKMAIVHLNGFLVTNICIFEHTKKKKTKYKIDYVIQPQREIPIGCNSEMELKLKLHLWFRMVTPSN